MTEAIGAENPSENTTYIHNNLWAYMERAASVYKRSYQLTKDNTLPPRRVLQYLLYSVASWFIILILQIIIGEFN